MRKKKRKVAYLERRLCVPHLQVASVSARCGETRKEKKESTQSGKKQRCVGDSKPRLPAEYGSSCKVSIPPQQSAKNSSPLRAFRCAVTHRARSDAACASWRREGAHLPQSTCQAVRCPTGSPVRHSAPRRMNG